MKHNLDLASVFVLNAMNKMEVGTVTTGVTARDLNHAAFIAKSEYILPQLGTRIDFITVRGLLVPIANKTTALYEIAFKKVADGFEWVRLDTKTSQAIEALA